MMISSTTIHQIHLFFLEIFKVRCQCQTQHLRKTRLFPFLRFRTKIIYIFLPTQILKRLKDFDCFQFPTQIIYNMGCLWINDSSEIICLTPQSLTQSYPIPTSLRFLLIWPLATSLNWNVTTLPKRSCTNFQKINISYCNNQFKNPVKGRQAWTRARGKRQLTSCFCMSLLKMVKRGN